MTSIHAVTVVCALSLLTSCSLFAPAPAGDDPAAGKDTPSYLDAGPTTKVDVSPGQTNLLQHLKQEKELTRELRAQVEKLTSNASSIRVRLSNTEAERDRERAGRIAAEALHKEAVAKLRDRESRILNAALERAKLQQELLMLKIAAAEQKLGVSSGASATQTGPATPGR